MEGGAEIRESIERILCAGIPVMGHLGLTPQSINRFGTYSVRAREKEEAELQAVEEFIAAAMPEEGEPQGADVMELHTERSMELRQSMRDFVDEYFKMEGTILKVNSEKKGKAEEVYINLGSMNGVKEAQKFTVYAIREVAGREAK